MNTKFNFNNFIPTTNNITAYKGTIAFSEGKYNILFFKCLQYEKAIKIRN